MIYFFQLSCRNPPNSEYVPIDNRYITDTYEYPVNTPRILHEYPVNIPQQGVL